MKFSNKIQQKTQQALFQAREPSGFEFEFKGELLRSSSVVTIYYETLHKEGELCIGRIVYTTDLQSEYLGVLDGYIEFIKGKPVEVLDRITPKELDYFLRDKNSVPAFEAYSSELFEILSLGESILKIQLKKGGLSPLFNPEVDGVFNDLSFSEQVEFFEEFCSKYVNGDPSYDGVELSISNIDKNILEIDSFQELGEDKIKMMEQKFNQEFSSQFQFKLRFN